MRNTVASHAEFSTCIYSLRKTIKKEPNHAKTKRKRNPTEYAAADTRGILQHRPGELFPLRVRDHPGPWQQQLRGSKTRRQRAHVAAVRKGVRKGITGKRRPLRTAGGEDRCSRRGEEIKVMSNVRRHMKP